VADETKTLIVTQPKGDAFVLAGSDCEPPINHRFEGGVTHRTDKPVVHMHLWNEECVGKLDGQVVVRGDDKAPVVVAHNFPGEHRQAHRIETGLGEPIHHALQMRTPLQLRFCNSWHVGSDYSIGVDVAGRRLIDIRLTGATVATPQPCEDDCPPPKTGGTPASGPASGVG
jgi:hypothetical protein